jgi:group I intron endonuclease
MENVIYRIRNVVNGHYYIGSTVHSRKRFWAHRKALRAGVHDCIRLQRAWNKYGEDCFKFEILEQVGHRSELFPAEQKLLDEHFGKDYCYNVAAHADAPMRDASPEMRARLAAKTKEWIAWKGHPRLGAFLSDETKEHIRQQKLANPTMAWLGKTRSEETKAKISAAQKGVPKKPGRKVSLEGMAKIRANIEAGRSHMHWTGRTHTDEAKEKMSRSICARKPDGTTEVFKSITYMRDNLGVSIATVIKACKSGATIKKGTMAGWKVSYGEEGLAAPE